MIPASEVVDATIFESTKISNEFTYFAEILAQRWNLKVPSNLFKKILII
jgi:hypothetical protein